MRTLVFIFFLMLGFTACQKDEVSTFGQQTASRIQADAQQAGANTANVYANNNIQTGGTFSFDGDFIIVGSARYNLNQLIGYQIINLAGVRVLILYF